MFGYSTPFHYKSLCAVIFNVPLFVIYRTVVYVLQRRDSIRLQGCGRRVLQRALHNWASQKETTWLPLWRNTPTSQPPISILLR